MRWRGVQVAVWPGRPFDRLGRHHDRMDEPFVLEGEGHKRWTLYPAVDPYGDGYVARLRVELDDDGMHAETTATIDSHGCDLATFLRQLAMTSKAGMAPGHGAISTTR